MTQVPLDLNRICLFFDIDGTLVDLAPKPTDVVVDPHLLDDLQLLAKRVNGALALISGRPIPVIDELFRPVKFKAAGVHGAQLRLVEDGPTEVVSGPNLSEDLREDLAELALHNPGVLIEDKGVAIAVHYRAAPTAGEALHSAIETMLEECGDRSLGILAGKLVYEVKRLSHDKGTALDTFMARPPFKGRRPVFIGDDVTDLAAFSILPRYRGVAYAVGRDLRGVPRGFETAAQVREWIANLTGHAEAAA
jgi:trehalose 6-phosphate phosphatase